MDECPAWVVDLVSPARFSPYLSAAGGDVSRAVQLYGWNSEIAAAFVHPLHYLEVALRNALHCHLRDWAASDTWWTQARLTPAGQRMITAAEAGLRAVPGRGQVPDDIVAKLSLGFWVSLLSGAYHRPLWVPVLHRAFPGAARGRLHHDYESVRRLRNRVMHHEPIHHRHLAADHAMLCRLLGQLSKDALAHMAANDRVPEILARRDGLNAGGRT